MNKAFPFFFFYFYTIFLVLFYDVSSAVRNRSCYKSDYKGVNSNAWQKTAYIVFFFQIEIKWNVNVISYQSGLVSVKIFTTLTNIKSVEK